MISDRQAVERALTNRLKELISPEVAAHFAGGSHTRRFADNLLPTFPAQQIDELREQLKAGGGSELTPNVNGKRRAHAPYSSAALAFNAFGRWLGDEAGLQVAGISGFEERLRVEAKARIRHGGGTANLDVLLKGSGFVVGVESKLAEHANEHVPVAWKPAYKSPKIAELLDAKWRSVLEDSLHGHWQPKRLGIEQLVKHVLGLTSAYPDVTRHLVYVYWEPENGDELDWVLAHRAEVEELRVRVDGSDTVLHTLPYSRLLKEWDTLSRAPAWVKSHVAELRRRYSITV